MKQSIILYSLTLLGMVIYQGCKPGSTAEKPEVQEKKIETPVTVTAVTPGPLAEYIELNATSTYLQSNIVKSYSNGYLKAVKIKPGQFVNAGQIIFIIQTKESSHIGSIINNLDSTYKFSGVTQIKAPQSGYVTQLNHQIGDYVQDGEQLAAINNSNSFGFLLNVPYEYHKYLPLHKAVEVSLPDSSHLQGTVSEIMPAVDSVSQTQRMLIQVNSGIRIPENLIAKVRILISQREQVITLPREAVMSDESQTHFWVMKLIDSTTAVKVPITPGTQTRGRIEIMDPKFATGDLILTSGNYGLSDTAHVKIVNPEP